VKLGPEIRVSDGLVVRLVDLERSGDPPIVWARYTESARTLVLERSELAAMLALLDGTPVTDINGWTHQGGQSWRAVR
jgi:hypothetical protein